VVHGLQEPPGDEFGPSLIQTINYVLPNAFLKFRRPIVLSLHLTLIPFGYWAAFALRFDVPVPAAQMALFWTTLLFLLPIRVAAFSAFGLFHGWWRHVGVQDVIDLVKAVTVSSALLLAAVFMFDRLEGLPRSIIVLDWIVAIFLFGGARFAVRTFRERNGRWRGGDRRATPALVIGAGDAAERLLRQLHHGGGEFRAVGLVDDDPAKQGMRLHGVPVLGDTRRLGSIVDRSGAKLLVIAIPSASREEMQRLVERCMVTKIEFKIVPPLLELLDGRARVSQLRKVQIEDLLGREAVELDLTRVRADLAGKVVLITGGAGSIGSELARQVATFGPDRLVILDQAETPLYFTNLELSQRHPNLALVPVVADVTDAVRVDQVFASYRPHYVFHAAAYKHVPMMEANVGEAVRNNVLGTLCMAEAAARHGADKFVLISTDKAVHPSSVMGATKRVAERVVLGWPALRKSVTDFRAVRFGNVLGSDGSVLPVFRKQLATGGPLTVTHEDVTRYFMTIPEAVQLVLQASAIPEAAGRISMLDMGEPVRVVELAENLIRLSGLEPYKDVPIVFSGLRPGEKLHEELLTELEETFPTELEKVYVVRTNEADGGAIVEEVDRLAAAVACADTDDLHAGLRELVPECAPPLRGRGGPKPAAGRTSEGGRAASASAEAEL
jgi:FlaA1/EpsC-like NDP-sugar epimerase